MKFELTSCQRTWLISGSSKGLGFSLVKNLLQLGYNVAAYTRKKENVENSIKESIENDGIPIDTSNLLILEVDIKDEEKVKESIQLVLERFGTIDVVTNCAGYGLFGALEFCNQQEVFDQFQINVFATLNVIRHSLPVLRNNVTNKMGPRIYNISSICGFFSDFGGISLYSSSKKAIDGFSEGLAVEAKEWNVHITTVNLGSLKTSFLKENGDMIMAKSNNPETYKCATEIINKHKYQFNGNQLGDPNKVSEVLISMATTNKDPPVHLFLGSDSLCLAQLKIKLLSEEIEKYKLISNSIGFDNSKPFDISNYISK